jgi:hypothetical protein
VFDIAASQNKIKQPVKLDLPLISVQSGNVTPGAGSQKVEVEITTNKPLASPGLIWIFNSFDGYKIRIPANKSGVIAKAPFSVEIGESNGLYNPFVTEFLISIGALRGVLEKDFRGGVTVTDNDSPPTILVTKRTEAFEGSKLEWKFKLSSATTGLYIICFIVPPSSGTELTSDDVAQSWLQLVGGFIPSTATPLSEIGLYNVQVYFPYGYTTGSIVIPIRNDAVMEGSETITMKCSNTQLPWQATLVGTVLAS